MNIIEVEDSPRKKRVLGIADSPKLTTGFGNVSEEIYKGFIDEFDFTAFGILDKVPDTNGELPYGFIPTDASDEMGIGNQQKIIELIKDEAKPIEEVIRSLGHAAQAVWWTRPDLVWIMCDPGNLYKLVPQLAIVKQVHDFKILAYIPVEGEPVSTAHLDAMNMVHELGGEVVLWCESAQRAVEKWGGIKLEFCYFGMNHGGFREIPVKDLRKKLGLDSTFICGMGGTNKRTKNFPALIYTAEVLKNENILWYMHTTPEVPAMFGGYNLVDLSYKYKVHDKILWKPQAKDNDIYGGHARKGMSVEELLALPDPTTEEEWLNIWASLDYVTRINMLDLFVDVSQVEGWGLIPGEAMACGVPCILPKDRFVREEIYWGSFYEATPYSEWDTWHTGVRLLGVNPHRLANKVLDMKADLLINKAYYKTKGFENVSSFDWEDTRKFMVNKIKRMLNEDLS